MSIKAFTGLLILVLLAAPYACVNLLSHTAAAELNQDIVQLEGWFSAKGEWALFPTQDFESYNPYVNEEEKKCISLVNSTGLPRSEFQDFHGKNVVVSGKTFKYDNLLNGNNVADRLLSKKYFKNEVVENFCLRDFVFIVISVSEKKMNTDSKPTD